MKKYLTPINKLHLSVFFGWGGLLVATLHAFSSINQSNHLNETLIVSFFWAFAILSIRYSVLKPIELLGATLSGWATMTLFDYLAGVRHNSGPNIFFWTIVLVMFLFYFVKGTILSTYFLVRETYHLVMYYRNKQQFTRNIRVMR